jgi:hypothetical protein
MDSKQRRLSVSTEAMLEKTDEERIAYINTDKWVPYTAANEILKNFEDLLNTRARSRAPCRLLIAESNNGKTSLLNRFAKLHPSDPNIEGDTAKIPVVRAVLNGSNEKVIALRLLESMFQTIPPNARVADLQEQLISVLRRIRPGVILLDEANTLISGSAVKTRNCFNLLKDITNQTSIPIIAAGTREALTGFRSDEQIENRFEPLRLELWSKGPELQKLLKGMEHLTPLKEHSGLADPNLADEIRVRSGGLIGEIATLVNRASIYAIKERKERITVSMLDQCGYVPVYKRKLQK